MVCFLWRKYGAGERFEKKRIPGFLRSSAAGRIRMTWPPSSTMDQEVDKAQANLAQYEKIKKFALLDRDFELESGEVTPSLKVKRNIIEKKYSQLIDSLYEGLD
jgi:hypothetical protein